MAVFMKAEIMKIFQLLEDGSYAQIRGDSVSKNVIFSQTKDSHAVRISNSATDSYQPQAQSSQYGNNDYEQKTEIDNGMTQDNGINVQQYQQAQEDVSQEVKEEIVVKTVR